MIMKSLTSGLIILLAATSAMVTAPAASAAVRQEVQPDRASCTLTVRPFRGADTGFGQGDRARFRVVFSLRSDSDGANSLWTVEIRQNGNRIELGQRHTHLGSLSVVKVTRDTYRRDRFTAIATNRGTGRQCRGEVVEAGIRL